MAKANRKKPERPAAPRKYPYTTLRQCMRLAGVVKDHGGDSASVPKSVIASDLEMDQGSSVFAQLVASAKTYGIVDGHQELALTDLGREYFFPLSEDGRRMAELQFLVQPPAFEYLVNRFDGSRLPSSNIIANELGRNCGVTESWRSRAASFFVSTAEELGVIDSGNFLRYEATKHSQGSLAPRTRAGTERDETPPAIKPDSAANVRSQATPTDAHFFSPTMLDDRGNKTIWAWGELRVETPHDMTMPMWERLSNYVQVIKPDEQGG